MSVISELQTKAREIIIPTILLHFTIAGSQNQDSASETWYYAEKANAIGLSWLTVFF